MGNASAQPSIDEGPWARLTPRGARSRAQLLAAARAELVEAGGRLEIAALARRTGTSAALLYRYFGSKDGLVAAVVHQFYDDYEAAVFLGRGSDATDSGAGDWRSREHARIEREVIFLYDHPLARAVIARQLQEPAAAQVDAERLVRQIEVAARNVRRGQREGAIDPEIDADLSAAAYLGAFRELVAAALRRSPAPAPRVVIALTKRVAEATVPSRPAGVSTPTPPGGTP